MLEVKNVSKTFIAKDRTVNAVNDASFKVKKGEIFGIIGLSGAGKSTLLRCINALEKPDEGEIFMDGKNILTMNEKELSKTRQDIGMIFQHFNLLMQKNALQNVLLPAKIHHADPVEAKEKALEMLELVGLSDKVSAYPAQLSGGEKQRLAIARALVTSPKLLLSDEATSALDPKTTEQILLLLKKIVKEYDLSIVMITHQMEVAKEICDNIAVMKDGVIVEKDSVQNLFLKPKEAYTQEMIRGTKETQPIKRENGTTVYRLGFHTVKASTPVISAASKKFDIDINILAGDIHHVLDEHIGSLYVEIWGEDSEIEKCLNYFKEEGVSWEVLN